MDKQLLLEEIYKQKKIWRGNEIPIANHLLSFQKSLTEEFLTGFSSLEEACTKYTTDNLDLRMLGISLEETANGVKSKNKTTGEMENSVAGWKAIQFKYGRHDDLIDFEYERTPNDRLSKKYPTAFNLFKSFGKDCAIANYSILAPQTILQRHSGPENNEGKYIRIHIPLIIPEGEVFLEVSGEKVKWDTIWGFNHQFAHSAYNLTDEWRVIFMLDLTLEGIGMTNVGHYQERWDLSKMHINYEPEDYMEIIQKYGERI